MTRAEATEQILAARVVITLDGKFLPYKKW
jgi:cyanate lyase